MPDGKKVRGNLTTEFPGPQTHEWPIKTAVEILTQILIERDMEEKYGLYDDDYPEDEGWD